MALSPTSSVKSVQGVNGGGGMTNGTYLLDPSLLDYDGRGMHHIMYFSTVPGTVTISAGVDGTRWTEVAVIASPTIVRTGAITDMPYHLIKIVVAGGTAVMDLQSFGTVVR